MSTPFWINPCNIEKRNISPLKDLNLEEVKSPEAVLANNILNQTNVALTSAYQIKNQFISTIFRMEYDKAEEQHKDHKLCFMPTLDEIPKSAGKRLSLVKLKNIKFSAVLPTIYTSLQKTAAGMELVFKNANYKRFKDTQYHLRNLLCEIYTALKESKIDMPKDINRSVVPKYYRNMKKPEETKVRDYIVFRDYINILEYTMEVFSNMLQKYPTISFFKTNLTVQSF